MAGRSIGRDGPPAAVPAEGRRRTLRGIVPAMCNQDECNVRRHPHRRPGAIGECCQPGALSCGLSCRRSTSAPSPATTPRWSSCRATRTAPRRSRRASTAGSRRRAWSTSIAGSYGGRGARVAGVAFRDVAELDRGAATDVAGPGRGDGHDGNPKGDARPLSRPRRLVSIRPSLHTRPDEGEPRPPSPWIVGSSAAPSFVTFTTVAR